MSALMPLATSEEVKVEQQSLARLESKGLRLQGSVRLQKFQLQSADLRTGAVSAYACVDLSEARVESTKGEDVTPSARGRYQTSLARFVFQADELKVRESKTWDGESIC